MFKTIDVSSEQQSRNRRDIETMLSGTLDEVVDSFIPWKDISKAYFQAKSVPEGQKRPDTPIPPKSEVIEPPKPELTFGESETVEFETDNEDDDEEERPRLKIGEDIKLDLDDDDEEPAAQPTGVVKLDI
jgi:hypothetical protein